MCCVLVGFSSLFFLTAGLTIHCKLFDVNEKKKKKKPPHLPHLSARCLLDSAARCDPRLRLASRGSCQQREDELERERMEQEEDREGKGETEVPTLVGLSPRPTDTPG